MHGASKLQCDLETQQWLHNTHNQNYKWPKRDNSAKAGADIPMPIITPPLWTLEHHNMITEEQTTARAKKPHLHSCFTPKFLQVLNFHDLRWNNAGTCQNQNSSHHGAYLLGTSKVPSRTKILIIVPLHIWNLAQNLYEWCLLLGVPLTAYESASTWPVIPHTSISDRVDILVSLLLTPLGIPQGVRLHATMTTACSFPDMNQALTL